MDTPLYFDLMDSLPSSGVALGGKPTPDRANGWVEQSWVVLSRPVFIRIERNYNDDFIKE